MKYVLLEKIKYNLDRINNTHYLVLKSDAYGFGLKQVLKVIKKTNLYKFCVINLDDAITIRKTIINSKILLITPFNKEMISYYKKYKIEVSINNIDDFNFIKEKNVKYQIALNTGMNRFGMKQIINEFYTNNLTGIYSHNATNDLECIQNQLNVFNSILDYKDNLDIHYFSSQHKNMNFGNCRRIGEAIYNDALIIKAKIIHYNYVKKGEFIGYDYSYKAKNNILVGVLDIGYADGLIRNCNGFKVYSRGSYYELIGKSCMNHSFVLLDIEDIKEVDIISNNNKIENYLNFFKVSKHEVFISYGLSKNNYI
ncbi:MAG: alanine racemase [bacterium]